MGLRPRTTSATAIEGLLVFELKEIDDERGVIREAFRTSDLAELLGAPIVQVNVTETVQGGVRGMHGEAMTKLVTVASGEAFGAWVDARRDSSTFGALVTLNVRPGISVLVPPGVCNGFQSTGEGVSQYVYCFDREWAPDLPGVAVNPLDPDLDIAWPIAVDPSNRAQLSDKDASLPRLSDL
jgi:dTDP-4-dehydrorhamnose 3,5-epimerase